MQELALDATVANRFIASLSKSLQALCHGCMDFDSGIEIVGFINVNIDSGSKVDYVLNEKVQRCANNSMTFVSNSFLAKKETPKKQTRDGACSPVPEFSSLPRQQQQQPYQHSHQQQPEYPPYPSSNAQAFPGAQKRPWRSGERQGRGLPRKQPRGGGGRAAYSSTVGHGAADYGSQGHVAQNQSEMCDTPANCPSGSSDIVSVKKEAFESGHYGSDSADASNDNANAAKSDCNFGLSLNIKPDPESVLNPDENVLDGNQNDNFLNDPSDSNYQHEIPAQSDDTSLSGKDINPSTQFTDNTYLEQHNQSQAGSSNALQRNQFDDSQSYPQSSFSGQEGEGASRDASGFDVIEIDEDDEDMQVMFGDNHSTMDDTVFTSYVTKRGKKSPLINGYRFCLERRNAEGRSYWRCCRAHILPKCQARCVTDHEVTVMYSGKLIHNHDMNMHGEHSSIYTATSLKESLKKWTEEGKYF